MNEQEELEFLRNHYRQSFNFMCALLQANGGKIEIPWNDIAVVPHPDIVEIVQYENLKDGSWVYELKPKYTIGKGGSHEQIREY
jgi:hypothetical protein